MRRGAYNLYGWLLLLPAMALLALFTHWPALATFIDSFRSTPKLRRASVFVGMDNYSSMLSDSVFWQALFNNLLFALGTIPISIALALVMAIWVNDRIAGRAAVRMAYFTPTVLPMIAVANIWLFFYIAALQQISPTLAEAAALEGASRFTFFRRVQFPLLMPTTLFVLVNAVINAFRTIDHIIVMTRGGPATATTLLLYYIYEVGFKYWDSTYAAALTVILLVLLAAVALSQYVLLERRIHYR